MYSEVIKSKLSALGKTYKKSGDHYLLAQCLNPHHNDSHGSFSINTNTGGCKCFTCGYSCGISFFTNREVSEEQEVEMARQATYLSLKEKLKREELGLEVLSGLPLKADKEVEENYRGFSRNTINQFNLYECTVGRYKNRVIFPFLPQNGFTSRTHDKESNIKYLHSKGFNTKTLLYPKHLIPEGAHFVVLVEGIIDCISLWQAGIPSICNFGVANNFSFTKVGDLLAKGIETIYVMFDNDKAGQEAQKKLLSDELLGEHFCMKNAKELTDLEEFYSSGCKDYNEWITSDSIEFI